MSVKLKLLFITFILLGSGTLFAEVANPKADPTAPMTRDEVEKTLEFKGASLKVENAKNVYQREKLDFERIKKLFLEKVMTKLELERAQTKMEKAELDLKLSEINLQKTRLGFLGGASYVRVLDAKKYRGENDEKIVSVTLLNDSNVSLAKIFSESNHTRPETLLTIQNIRVSLHDKVNIGQPFEQNIVSLEVGVSKTLTFKLLRDVDSVTVSLNYLNQKFDHSVYLRKESRQKLPNIDALQFSQEGQLGTEVTYPLVFEWLSENESSFRVSLTGLDDIFPYRFVYPGSNATVNHMKFSSKNTSRELRLMISIPKKLKPELVSSLQTFEVHVMRSEELKKITRLIMAHGRTGIPAEKLAEISSHRVSLELTPKGVGEIDLLFSNSFKSIKHGMQATFNATIHNTGTLKIQSLEPEFTLPPGWTVEMIPKQLEALAPDKKKEIKLIFSHEATSDLGEYSLRTLIEGEVGSDQYESELRAVTIKIEAPSNIMANLVMIGVLVLLMVFIGGISLWVARR